MSFAHTRNPSVEELTFMKESRRQIGSRDGSDTSTQQSARKYPPQSPPGNSQHHRPSGSFYQTAPRMHRIPLYYEPSPESLKQKFLKRNAANSYENHPAFYMRRSDSYVTPPIYELLRILQSKGGYPNQEDQIWQNLYLGDEHAATDKENLERLGITHILNAADGLNSVNTGAYFYKDMPIAYYGVQALDESRFNMYAYFYPAAKFIKHGLSTPGGKVLVHCAMGISRAPSLVVAFLMIYADMNLVEALETVLAKRPIYPNKGFLSQLRELDMKLAQERAGDSSPEP